MSGLVVPGTTEAAAVAAYPPLQHLLDLLDGGWRFLPIVAAQLDGFRRWPDGWTDGIRVRHAGDALGIRTDRDQRIVWEFSGSLGEVVGELLLLPAPGHRLAPRLARGHGPQVGQR